MFLILNADDLGYSPAVNASIAALHESGRLNSTSLVVNLPHSAAAMAAVRRLPRLAVGVHLNLTRGRPCLPPEKVPTLVQPDGTFYRSPVFFARAAAGRVSASEAVAECRAQVERALEAGIDVKHLDTHSHWHAIPRLTQLVGQLASEYRVPRVRVANLRCALVPGLLWWAPVWRRARSGDRPWQTDYLVSLHQWLSGSGQPSPGLSGERIRQLLDRPGVTVEVVTHPGRADDPDFPTDTLAAGRRQWELELLRSDWLDDWLESMNGTLGEEY